MAETERPTDWIRLSCDTCDAGKDGITPDELAECVLLGWAGVTEEQSYEDSIRTYDDPADAPAGYSVLDWWTHLGTCPECSNPDRSGPEDRPATIPFPSRTDNP